MDTSNSSDSDEEIQSGDNDEAAQLNSTPARYFVESKYS